MGWLAAFISSMWNLFVFNTIMTAVFVVILLFLLQFLTRHVGRRHFTAQSSMVKELKIMSAEERARRLADLRTTNDGSLSDLWRSYVDANKQPLAILLTGVTGYVGGVVLHELLCQIQSDKSKQKKNHRIYVVVRAKTSSRTGHSSSVDRLNSIKKDPLFDDVLPEFEQAVEMIETKDLGAPSCGMDTFTKEKLRKAKVTHIIHCAADVRFNPPLDSIATINISATLQLQEFARNELDNVHRFIYVSTAFVTQNLGTPEAPNPEALFPLGNYKASAVYESMIGDNTLANKCKKDLNFENNYVMSKCIAEHLLSERKGDASKDVPVTIIRPAIVGPSAISPYPGYNGRRPSTVTAFLLLLRARLAKVTKAKYTSRPVIPVDVTAVSIVHAIVEKRTRVQETTVLQHVRNLVWGLPVSFHGPFIAAVALNRMSTTEAAILIFLNDLTTKYPWTFDIVEFVLSRLPLHIFGLVQKIQLLINPKYELPITHTKLLSFLDLLSDWDKYMCEDFHFEVSTRIPTFLSDSVISYFTNIFKSVELFVPPFMRHEPIDLEQTLEAMFTNVDLRYYLFPSWYCITQPTGALATRIFAYLQIMLTRSVCDEMFVKIFGLTKVMNLLSKLEAENSEKKPLLVLSPTSENPLFDILTIVYMCFCMPGLGWKIPHIALPDCDDDVAKNVLFQLLVTGGLVENVSYGFEKRLVEIAESSEALLVPLKGARNQDLIGSLSEAAGGRPVVVVPISMFSDKGPQAMEKIAISMRGLSLTSLLLKVLPGTSSTHVLGRVRVVASEPYVIDVGSNTNGKKQEMKNELAQLAKVLPVSPFVEEGDIVNGRVKGQKEE